MNQQERRKNLLEATQGIREEYIEEAAENIRKRPRWAGLVAAAAALVLVVGAVLFWPVQNIPDTTGEYLPIFAIRAYAQDGTVATLNAVGDASQLQTNTSDLFSGKEVYTLDISLTDADGNRLDLMNTTFRCFHRGKNVALGESDEQISITLVDENGFYGYRITGWCEEFDLMDITIRDASGRILHQKNLQIIFDGKYNVLVSHSYVYEPELSTEELIAKLFYSGNDYWRTVLASSPYVEYRILAGSYGGFAELEERPDAASLLLQRWVAQMEAEPLNWVSVEWSGRIGLVLSQDAYWNNLTEEELALIESYGIPRRTWNPEDRGPFPGKKTFRHDLVLEGHYMSGNSLEVTYNGHTVQGKDEHLRISSILSSSASETELHGWGILGWFDEPTEVTLTVTDKEGNLVCRQILLITPTEAGYEINVTEETP